MIPRYQKVVVWLLLIACVLMAAYLVRMRTRAQDRLATVPTTEPMPAPVEANATPITLMIASDTDGSLSAVHEELPLPTEKTTRAHALLNDLFAVYARSGSTHPLPAVTAVNDVFLLPVPGTTKPAAGELAVINLNGSFVHRHPSGILVEMLTLLSILGTMHANMPQIAQVRFLVDGKPADTLAGHADLTRTYLTGNDVPVPSGASAPNGSSSPAKTTH